MIVIDNTPEMILARERFVENIACMDCEYTAGEIIRIAKTKFLGKNNSVHGDDHWRNVISAANSAIASIRAKRLYL